MDRPKELPRTQEDLLKKREDLHGKRRKLHEQLSYVCERFLVEDLTRVHKQHALVGELQYLLDYYRDDQSWEGVE